MQVTVLSTGLASKASEEADEEVGVRVYHELPKPPFFGSPEVKSIIGVFSKYLNLPRGWVVLVKGRVYVGGGDSSHGFEGPVAVLL